MPLSTVSWMLYSFSRGEGLTFGHTFHLDILPLAVTDFQHCHQVVAPLALLPLDVSFAAVQQNRFSPVPVERVTTALRLSFFVHFQSEQDNVS